MRVTLALIFFLSGASALIFEALWFRLAGLSLGNSVWSASLVLAAFMGGLALGNALVARFHDRLVRPVRLYAFLEFTIGIGGIAVVLLLPQFPSLLGPVLGGLTETPAVLNTARASIAFSVLVVPAIAMGATLPVLAQALSRKDPNFGSNIGFLYGWNTLGAMLGVIGAELVLVPLLGILSSGFVALTCNLLAAAIALRFSEDAECSVSSPESADHKPVSVDGRTRRFIAVAFLSGLLMLALEVVWFRFLLLTRDGTSLIFAVMLAVVLGGIAIGGLVAGRLFKRDDRAFRWLGHVTAASAALVVLTYWGYDLFAVYDADRDTTTGEFVLYSIFLMFPVAFLSGVAFTMVNRAVKDNFGASARTAGIATFFNTTGAMLGSLLAGFLLLPALGMELSFFVIAALYGLLALLVPSDSQVSPAEKLWGRGAVAAAATSLVLFPFGLMQESFFGPTTKHLPGHTLISAREGLVETIRYYSSNTHGQAKYYRLVTNGHSMSATSTAAKRYMKLYVYWPLALKPDSKDALLISFGVASTAKALTDSHGLESIDIVDISEDILEMSSIVYPGDANPLHDDRVNVHIEDGRFFLNTTEKHYDLITSEPPPPKMAGVVNLYSQEYFKLIRERLVPGGYTTYWLPVQQLEPTDTLAITKAFCNAFDDCSLWSGGGLEWMLVGSNGATSGSSLEEFSAQWRDPVVGPELVSLGFESPQQFGSLFMADAAFLKQLTAHVAPVKDNYPARLSSTVVSYLDKVALYDVLMDEEQRLERFRSSQFVAAVWPEELRREAEQYFEYEHLLKNHFTGGGYRRQDDPYFWASLDDMLTETSLTTLPLWLLGSDAAAQRIVSELMEQGGYRTEFALDLAKKFTAERDFATALMYATDHVNSAGSVPLWDSNFYLYLLGKNGNAEQAAPIISQLSGMGQPEADRFVGWYTARFYPDSSEPSQVAEAF